MRVCTMRNISHHFYFVRREPYILAWPCTSRNGYLLSNECDRYRSVSAVSAGLDDLQLHCSLHAYTAPSFLNVLLMFVYVPLRHRFGLGPANRLPSVRVLVGEQWRLAFGILRHRSIGLRVGDTVVANRGKFTQGAFGHFRRRTIIHWNDHTARRENDVGS